VDLTWLDGFTRIILRLSSVRSRFYHRTQVLRFWYLLSVSVWVSLARRSWVLGLLATYPMLLSLELGASAPLLAWLCLSPLGAFVAMLLKPYLVMFVLLHAVNFTVREHRKWGGALAKDFLQNESHISRSSLRGDLFVGAK